MPEAKSAALYLVLAAPLPTPARLRPCCPSLALALGLLAGPLALTARAEGTASTFVVDRQPRAGRHAQGDADITFAGQVPAEVNQKFETRRTWSATGGTCRRSVASPPPPAEPGHADDRPSDDRFTIVTFPTNGPPRSIIDYTVIGAVIAIPDGTALEWPLLQG